MSFDKTNLDQHQTGSAEHSNHMMDLDDKASINTGTCRFYALFCLCVGRRCRQYRAIGLSWLGLSLTNLMSIRKMLLKLVAYLSTY